jgi:hypothetical protein
MSTDQFLSNVNSQNSRQVKRVPAATIREGGPSRVIVTAIGLGLLLACLLIGGLASFVCDIGFSPRPSIMCPAATATPPYPYGTTITPSTYTSLTPPTPTTPVPTTVTPSTYTSLTPPTPTTPAVTSTTPFPTSPTPCTVLTPNPVLKDAAVNLALSLSDQFLRYYGVNIKATEAVPFNPICLGPDSDQLLGMLAPVVDANQIYKNREVEGIFYINDSRLVIETIILISKSAMQYSTLPLGSYMLACNHQRPDDCIAVSLQGEEFQIRPESISIEMRSDGSEVTKVSYEQGSIGGCFYVWRRKICITMFK